MRKLLTSSFALALLLALGATVGCGKGGSNAAAPAPSSPSSQLASTGVPECDEYIRKYMDCIAAKVPQAARAQYQAAFDQTVATWKSVAADPNGKAGLAMACKAAEQAAGPAMQAYGCSF